MYLSYSGFKLYQECPRAYWHRYIDKTKLPKPDNRVHMLYGDTVGKLFEAFYNEGIWRANTTSTLLARIPSTMAKIVQAETRRGGIFDWAEPKLKLGTRSIEEVAVEVQESVPRGLRIIRHHRLLGHDAQAEVSLDQTVEGHKLGGRADFLMRRVQGDLVLLDGKGSRWREKYVSRTQLLWYAMLYWLRFETLPDRLGFLFWRFEPEESMDWSGVTVSEVQSLLTAAMTAIEAIEAAMKEQLSKGPGAAPGATFWANPSSECKLCSYLPICAEGNKKAPKFDPNGVEDFSF